MKSMAHEQKENKRPKPPNLTFDSLAVTETDQQENPNTDDEMVNQTSNISSQSSNLPSRRGRKRKELSSKKEISKKSSTQPDKKKKADNPIIQDNTPLPY